MRVVRRLWDSAVFTSWASLAVRAGGLTLLIPLALTIFTTEEVLIWQLLSTMMLVISWLDFGFGPTFSRIVAFARGGGTRHQLETAAPGSLPLRGETEATGQPLEMGAVLGTQRRIYNWLALGAIAFAATGGTAALWRPMQSLSNPAEGWIAWGITIVSSLVALLNTYNSSVITGFNQIARFRRIDTLIGGIQLAASALVLLLGGGLIGFVLVTLAGISAIHIVSHRMARDCYGRDLSTWFDTDLLRAIWPSAWRAGVGILLSVGVVQASGMIVAQFASAADAAGYLLALRITSILAQIANVPFYTKLPRLSELRAAGDLPSIRETAARGMSMTAWILVLGTQSLIWIAPFALRLIDTGVVLPATLVLALMGLTQFVDRYASTHIQLYTTTNHVVWHIANGLSGGITVALYFALVPYLGIVGFPLAYLVGLLFGAAYSSHLSLASMDTNRRRFDIPIFAAPLALMVVGSIAALFLL